MFSFRFGQPSRIVSTMIETQVDGVASHERLAALGQKVLAGAQIDRADGQWLFSLESTADIFSLMSWANRIREHFKGNKVHLCSIVNVKAGGCSENCKFCAQSAAYQTEAPRYGLVDLPPVMNATLPPNRLL